MAEAGVINIPYWPRDAFKPFHDRKERFAVLVCHRRAGKTVATINDVVKRAFECNLQSPRFAYIAPLYRQAKTIAWDYLKRYTENIPGRTVNEAELRVDLPGDRRIQLFGADNPDSMRGVYFDGVVLDEPAQMKPIMWTEVIRPAIADRHGFAVFIGTPKGQNWFYERFRKAEKDDGWFTMVLKASKSGLLGQDEIDLMTRDMTPNQIEQELECSFEVPDSAQFIDGALVRAARQREMDRATGARVMGVDVARFGSDRSVILVRTDMIELIKVYKGLDTMQFAAMVAEQAAFYKPQITFVDGAGVGGGVVDRLRMMRFPVVEVQAGGKANASDRYGNKRAEMWGNTRDWLKDRGSLPDGPHIDELADDLVSPLYHYDNKNAIFLEKKEDMKARGLPSPDIGDALALTFAEPVAPPELQRIAWEEPQREYDPLDDY